MRVIIVDDEITSSQVLEKLIQQQLPQIEVVSICNKPEDAITCINEQMPDLVFLDIEMPRLSGFDILEKIEFKNFSIIFTTAHSQYGIKAIQYSAIDYLLKPISGEDLLEAVDRVASHIKVTQPLEKIKILLENIQIMNNHEHFNRIAFPTGEGLKFVNGNEIVRCMSNNNYTTILIDGTKILVSKTLKEIELLLSTANFCRVHNSHLVNINFITKFIKGAENTLIMTDNTKVEVSRRKKDELIKMLNL